MTTLTKTYKTLSDAVGAMTFAPPVTHVYNPLEYAAAPHKRYLEKYGAGPKGRVLWLGMNPGPWGMAQTGVPFGEVALARDWLDVGAPVGKPKDEHPKRPIQGYDCARSEVSGARLWGWARERYGTADAFFERFFVANYCPLIFLEASGRNRIPEKLTREERDALFAACDAALTSVVDVLAPRYIVGVGTFAEKCAKRVVGDRGIPIGRVLHPSPASPAANRGWAPQAEAQLAALGVLD